MTIHRGPSEGSSALPRVAPIAPAREPAGDGSDLPFARSWSAGLRRTLFSGRGSSDRSPLANPRSRAPGSRGFGPPNTDMPHAQRPRPALALPITGDGPDDASLVHCRPRRCDSRGRARDPVRQLARPHNSSNRCCRTRPGPTPVTGPQGASLAFNDPRPVRFQVPHPCSKHNTCPTSNLGKSSVTPLRLSSRPCPCPGPFRPPGTVRTRAALLATREEAREPDPPR